MSIREMARVFGTIALLMAACGDDGEVTLQQKQATCTEFADAVCGRLMRCGREFRVTRDYGSLEDCATQEEARCMRMLGREKSGHTVGWMNSCSQARKTQSCEDFLGNAPLPACNTPAGPLRDGEPCADPAQCRSTYCSAGSEDRCGRCATKLAQGGTCARNADCQAAFYCAKLVATDPTGSCQARLGEGEACNNQKPCLEDLVCHAQRTEMMVAIDGSCRARTAADGQPCNDTIACLTGLTCVGFDRAKAIDGACRPLALLDQSCDGGNRTAPDCDSDLGLFCFTDAVTKLKTCKPRGFADAGGACNRMADGTLVTCKGGANCVRPVDALTGTRPNAGMCAADAPEGMPCARDGADGPGCSDGRTCVFPDATATVGTCVWRDVNMCM